MEKIKESVCMVTNAAISFRAGYHHVKVDAENKLEFITVNVNLFTENALLNISY